MKKKRQRHYGYAADGSPCALWRAACVSEVKFPPRSKRLEGICAIRLDVLTWPQLVVGKTLDLIFGDPRVLRRCTILSQDDNPLPRTARFLRFSSGEFVFRYRGGRVWGRYPDFALLAQAEKELKRRKEERR